VRIRQLSGSKGRLAASKITAMNQVRRHGKKRSSSGPNATFQRKRGPNETGTLVFNCVRCKGAGGAAECRALAAWRLVVKEGIVYKTWASCGHDAILVLNSDMVPRNRRTHAVEIYEILWGARPVDWCDCTLYINGYPCRSLRAVRFSCVCKPVLTRGGY